MTSVYMYSQVMPSVYSQVMPSDHMITYDTIILLRTVSQIRPCYMFYPVPLTATTVSFSPPLAELYL